MNASISTTRHVYHSEERLNLTNKNGEKGENLINKNGEKGKGDAKTRKSFHPPRAAASSGDQ